MRNKEQALNQSKRIVQKSREWKPLASPEIVTKSPMRILHFAKLYHPVLGGCESSTRGLSIELARMGHNVSIVTSDAMELDGFKSKKYIGNEPAEDNGVTVLRFHVNNLPPFRTLINFLHMPLAGARKKGFVKPDSLLFLDALQSSTLITRQYIAPLCSSTFDVVNGTQIGHGELFFLEEACKKSHVPFVFTPRTHTLDPYTRTVMPMCLKIAKAADAIIVFTKHEKEYYTKNGIDPNKIFVTGIGIRLEEFTPPASSMFRAEHGIPSDHNIVLSIARMDKYKGANLIIESMKKVWKRKPNSTLVLIGKSTSYTKEIKRIAKKEKRIVLLPDASEEIKKEALFASTLLVNPSQIESFGRVFLEAWAAGKPVIGAKTPVNECVIDEGTDGLLLNNLDPDELAQNIVFLLENEKVASEMGKNGKRKTLRNYSWEKIAKQTLEVYKWAQEHRLLAEKRKM
jgi:glycosyltransferase involved in cell wall biosynthesis